MFHRYENKTVKNISPNYLKNTDSIAKAKGQPLWQSQPLWPV